MSAGVTAETFVPPGSSHIASFTYYPDEERLVVEFTSGDIYTYHDVDSETVGAWQRAGGGGRFFRARIRDSYGNEPGGQ